jgi:hypothetical protein
MRNTWTHHEKSSMKMESDSEALLGGSRMQRIYTYHRKLQET